MLMMKGEDKKKVERGRELKIKKKTKDKREKREASVDVLATASFASILNSAQIRKTLPIHEKPQLQFILGEREEEGWKGESEEERNNTHRREMGDMMKKNGKWRERRIAALSCSTSAIQQESERRQCEF